MSSLDDLLVEGVNELVSQGVAPGATAAVTAHDWTIAAAASGVRKLGETDAMTVDDPMHIGSCTKAVTATIIARAVEAGHLSWDAPVTTWLPNPVHSGRTQVNLIDLLSHRAGLAPYEEDYQIAELPPLSPIPIEQRAELTSIVMLEELETVVRDEFKYSNAGFAVAASVCETATSIPWETAVSDLSSSLGIEAGLGWPASEGRQAPWGHVLEDGVLTPHDPDDGYQIEGWIAPAGDVRISATEMCKWMRLHLGGIAGSTDFLAAESWRVMHTKHGRAGLGWGIQEISGQPASVHSGSAGTFSTLVVLLHKSQVGIVINANSGEEASAAAQVALLREVVARVT